MFRLSFFVNFTAFLYIITNVSATEKSISIGYGPTPEINLFLNRNAFSLYLNPYIDFYENDYQSINEYSARMGGAYTYTAFVYRHMECRAQFGAGAFGASREVMNTYGVSDRERQWGLEAWLQPEFRFYQRFSIVLESILFKNKFQEDQSEDGNYENPLYFSHRVHFEWPNFMVSELKIGFRYYFSSPKNLESKQ